MSKKQMEKELNYGDCFNFLGVVFSDLLESISIKKEIDKKKNSK
jgi:hypothetical protein